MKAPDFRYARPETLPEAIELLSDGEATPLAGGQSLLPMMNFRMASPGMLVDLNAIEGLAGIREDGGWIEIGAMTRYAALQRSETISGKLPLMARALPHVAHSAIRNRGTIGGSVALADPAAEMPAVLLALAGEVILESREGRRRVAADDWGLGLYETALARGELIVSVRFPAASQGQRFGFHELSRRHGDYAMAGVCIAAGTDPDETRIALFGVSDRAVRAQGVEAALAEGKGRASAIDTVVEGLSELDFHGDLHASPDAKRHLAGVALRRALSEVSP